MESSKKLSTEGKTFREIEKTANVSFNFIIKDKMVELEKNFIDSHKENVLKKNK
jgi:hypothetical protein